MPASVVNQPESLQDMIGCYFNAKRNMDNPVLYIDRFDSFVAADRVTMAACRFSSALCKDIAGGDGKNRFLAVSFRVKPAYLIKQQRSPVQPAGTVLNRADCFTVEAE